MEAGMARPLCSCFKTMQLLHLSTDDDDDARKLLPIPGTYEWNWRGAVTGIGGGRRVRRKMRPRSSFSRLSGRVRVSSETRMAVQNQLYICIYVYLESVYIMFHLSHLRPTYLPTPTYTDSPLRIPPATPPTYSL